LSSERFELDGAGYNLEIQGNGPALVLLHGFTGSAVAWRGFTAGFLETHRVIGLDALGHGLSDAPADPARYAMPQVAADFVALLDKLELENVALLGYSMGGRLALYLALTHPERVSRLILESASPGLANTAVRQARTASDNALAERLEREGVESFVAYWEKLPLWDSQVQLPASVRAVQHALRLRNNPQGLANSLRGMGTGVQPSLWERLPGLTIPTLLIAGELDQKFCEIGRQMQANLPDARLAIVPGAGHTVHLERPSEFEYLVKEFCNCSGSAGEGPEAASC